MILFVESKEVIKMHPIMLKAKQIKCAEFIDHLSEDEIISKLNEYADFIKYDDTVITNDGKYLWIDSEFFGKFEFQIAHSSLQWLVCDFIESLSGSSLIDFMTVLGIE